MPNLTSRLLRVDFGHSTQESEGPTWYCVSCLGVRKPLDPRKETSGKDLNRWWQGKNFLKLRNLPFDYGEGTRLRKGTGSCPGLVPVWKELWPSLLVSRHILTAHMIARRTPQAGQSKGAPHFTGAERGPEGSGAYSLEGNNARPTTTTTDT